MVERRLLIEELKLPPPAPVVDAAREREFVHGANPTIWYPPSR